MVLYLYSIELKQANIIRMSRESFPNNRNESQPSHEWLKKMGRKVGKVALAATVALGAAGGMAAWEAHKREEGHPKQIEVVQIDNNQRQQIDKAASEQAKHLLQPDTGILDIRKVQDGEASIQDGKLVVTGLENVGKSSGSGRGTISSEIVFEGAPGTTDTGTVAAYLESNPHVEHAHMTQADSKSVVGGGQGYELSIDLEGNTLTIISPEDVGPDGQNYSVDRPLDDYYGADPVDRGAIVASGINGVSLL
jgi:hypothetical protein